MSRASEGKLSGNEGKHNNNEAMNVVAATDHPGKLTKHAVHTFN